MESSVQYPRRNKRNISASIFTTLFASALLAIYLLPFLYMVLSALKTKQQMTELGTPFWPAQIPSFVYKGENTQIYHFEVHKADQLVDQMVDLSKYIGATMDIFNVPLPNGIEKNLALVIGFQKDAVFLDPQNPSADPILWSGGYYKALPRPWLFSPTWSNFSHAWTVMEFPHAFLNTCFYAFTTLIGMLCSCILVAYGFSRFHFFGRDFWLFVMLSTLFLPGAVTTIPTYTFFFKIGWVGTWLPLIIPCFFANAYITFLLRQFFMTLPRELDESAAIDGAGPLRILWSVIIPQSYPAILAVAMFHIVAIWDDFYGPVLYLSTKPASQPISVALYRFNSFYGSDPQYIQAGSMIAMILPLIIFALAQRYFVRGIVISGVEK